MAEYQSNTDLETAAQWLLAGDAFVLLTHAKPDGDAWGSVVALASTLKNKGKTVAAAFAPPVPASLAGLPGHELTITLDKGVQLPQVDRVVLLDTGAWSQCAPFADYLRANLDRTLIIDHHKTGDIDAALRFVDPTAAATCEILADLIPQLETSNLKPETCAALYTGLATDTGFFRFSNTSPRTLRLAADLVERGVDASALYEELELCERREKLELTACALDSIRWVANNHAAVLTLRVADFERIGALEEETERIVNIPLQVGDVRASVLVCEKKVDEKTICRVSARSKATGRTIDVAQLMSQFGGGGHARASGARVEGDADAVVPRIIAALERAFAP